MNEASTIPRNAPFRRCGVQVHRKLLLYSVFLILMSLALPSVARSEFPPLGPSPPLNAELFDNPSAKIEARRLITLQEKECGSLENYSALMKRSGLEQALMSSVSAWLLCSISKSSFALEQESAAEPQTEPDSVSLRVLWTVADYVRGPNARVDDEQARSLIFTPLDMTEESISFAGRVCKPITFSRSLVRLSDYLSASYGIGLQDLNLENQSAQVIQTTCDLPGFSEFLRLEDMRLLVSIYGVFYFLEPVIFR